jgi:hypothetical protein
VAFVFFAALDVLFRGWEDGEICFGGRVGEVWEVQNGREDGADGEREEGEDYERQVVDEDAELVGEETEVGFCCWMNLGQCSVA